MGALKTRKLLKNRRAGKSKNAGITVNWNVSGTRRISNAAQTLTPFDGQVSLIKMLTFWFAASSNLVCERHRPKPAQEYRSYLLQQLSLRIEIREDASEGTLISHGVVRFILDLV